MSYNSTSFKYLEEAFVAYHLTSEPLAARMRILGAAVLEHVEEAAAKAGVPVHLAGVTLQRVERVSTTSLMDLG